MVADARSVLERALRSEPADLDERDALELRFAGEDVGEDVDGGRVVDDTAARSALVLSSAGTRSQETMRPQDRG